jgi:2-polyprenyl-6-methoxyphenol hydroxylase-like FAD-dependent oxidoreductase
MHDVIVIGARVAGAATAMLLARRGHRVLVLDRAAFPSDTLSTHQVQVPGVARLHRWGLLDRLVAAGTPATRRVRFDACPVVLDGTLPAHEGVDALYSPRRVLLDGLLVDAAREAGAEVRERFVVEEVLVEDGRVTGIRGREKGGPPVTERARLVVGADGKHSLVAKTVRAAVTHERPPLTMACYAYWEGVPVTGGLMADRGRRMVGAWPTNDGLLMTYVALPIADADAFRDLETSLLAALDQVGDLGERVRAGRRAERVRATIDLPNRFVHPHGPGWALAGDAGLVMDPVTGQGIADAFRDAELLADAADAGLAGRRPMTAAMEGYRRARDRASLPMYRMTLDLAAFNPRRPEQVLLMRALAGRPADADRFLATLTGVVPVPEFFGPANLLRLLGARGLARAILARARGGADGQAA